MWNTGEQALFSTMVYILLVFTVSSLLSAFMTIMYNYSVMFVFDN